MLLKDLMQDVTLNANYTGIVTNDDNVLAINTGGEGAAVQDYAVVQGAIAGVEAQMSATTQTRQYLRAGQSTTKTGTQRTFTATGDRYIGDDFQDFAFRHENMYGAGEKSVVDYVWFNLYNGKGEKGKVSILVNSDGSGAAGDVAGIEIKMQKIGAAPTAFTYAAAP